MSPGDSVAKTPARQIVRRAAVLGAGTMGAQIAAVLANQGIPCDLLDLPTDSDADKRNRLADEAKKRLTKLSPSPIYTPDSLDLISSGNFDDDLARLNDADWVIEAIVENLDLKKELWNRVAPHLRPNVIASTNTSGIPIHSIAEALPEELQHRFLGTHFFNPPRYLRLLELVPTGKTDPAVVDAIGRFGEEVLGKGVVVAHDVPNFIGNRIGTYGVMVTLKVMEAMGLGPDEVDSISGPAMGRPQSATFRTLDIVGLDIFVDVCDKIRANIEDSTEKAVFELPLYIREMLDKGWLGEKSGQGFYKRVKEQGETKILALELESMEYRPRRRAQAPSLAAVRNIDDAAERLKTLLSAEDQAGQFAWRTLSQGLAYAASKVGEVADDIVSIDRAMRWGFGWELGPFEAWDVLGVPETARKMEADGIALPEWVTKLANEGGTFYQHETDRSTYATTQSTYAPVIEGRRSISLQRVRASAGVIAERPGASILDLGDGVAFLDFHSPKQAIGPDMIEMLEVASQKVPEDFRGLVIGSHVTPNFCVGANLFLILLYAQEMEWEEIDMAVRRFQHALLNIKRMPVPVVSAPYGMTLGGGAEIMMAADRIVAASESYIGQVEVGAGVIPAGGGCKELLIRALEGMPGGLAAFGNGRKRGALQFAPEPDPNPALAQVFQAIGTAQVAQSAVEARNLGFLRNSDTIVPNLDHIVYVAKETVISLDAQGYTPPAPVKLPVLGEGSRALLDLAAQTMVWSKFASEHDQVVARKLSYVLTGGDRPAGTLADEEYFLDLEREAFVSLCGEPKTMERMKHLLDTGRPLRN